MKRPYKFRATAICIASILATLVLLPAAQAQSSIVTSDSRYLTSLGLGAFLYKDTGEADPNWDYYTIEGRTAEYGGYQSDNSKSPLASYFVVCVPKSYAQEPPGSHEPLSGFFWSGDDDFEFSFQGITFHMKLPAYNIEYGSWEDSFWRYYYWDIDSFYAGGTWGFIYHDYTEYSVGIRVPQGYTFDAYFGGSQSIYEWGLMNYHLVASEDYYWLRLYHDPPGDGPSGDNAIDLPEQLPTIPTLPQPPHIVPRIQATLD